MEENLTRPVPYKGRLDLKNDYVFKRIFAKPENNAELKELTEAILNEKIKTIVVTNPEISKNYKDEKLGVLDIRAYMNDDTESRITRMEKEMLGAMQGGNLKDRFDTIKTASKHYNSYPELIQSQQIYPQNTFGYNPYGYSTSYGPAYGTYSSYKKPGILNRLFGGYSPGMLTGFTPPIYDPYSMYTRPGMGHSRYVRGMRGWHLRNRSTGSGTRVRILD